MRNTLAILASLGSLHQLHSKLGRLESYLTKSKQKLGKYIIFKVDYLTKMFYILGK